MLPFIVNLQFNDGIVGKVTLKQFRRKETVKRQEIVKTLLKARLTSEKLRRAVIIACYIPEEMAAFQEMED